MAESDDDVNEIISEEHEVNGNKFKLEEQKFYLKCQKPITCSAFNTNLHTIVAPDPKYTAFKEVSK